MDRSRKSGGLGMFHRFRRALVDRFSSAEYRSLLIAFSLALTWFLGLAIRLFSVLRFESIIHEYDPWFNYRSTRFMVENGFYKFVDWFDERAWYPLGRIVGGTVFPGLMYTSGLLHRLCHLVGCPLHIREVCVFLAPLFSGLTALATYALTRELFDASSGLLAALFVAIAPGYLSRSVAGSYDNEGIAIFAMMLTFFLWIKSLKSGKIGVAVTMALSYAYMVSAWGGYVFIINLIPLHVFVLILMGRFNPRLYRAYSVFFVIGTLLSMQLPFVGFQPVRTSEHMAALGTFGLVQIYQILLWMKGKRANVQKLFLLVLAIAAASAFAAVLLLSHSGLIAPWSGRFYSLWDTGYAKIHIPIITSVSEHQPTTWTSFYFDLHVLICLFPAGVWFAVREFNDERVFIVLYALFASYFAGVMVRLMLTLTPVVCVLAAHALSRLLRGYLKKPQQQQTKTSDDGEDANFKYFVMALLVVIVGPFFLHCTWISSNAYSSPSIILSTYGSDGAHHIIDDYREGYWWLSRNTPSDARVMSWWDYGYQIAGLGNRTTLVDNNTWNNTHIAVVGKAMSSPESKAIKILRDHDVDYVLVIFGGLIGYSGDDINKFLWMVRIAEGEFPNEIRETDYFTERGEFRVDAGGAHALLNSLMYSLSYYRFGEVRQSMRLPTGYDQNRQTEIGRKNIKLNYLEEVFTSENWIVRIYRVKKETNFDNIAAGKRTQKI